MDRTPAQTAAAAQIAQAGYFPSQIEQGLAYAAEQGAVTEGELFELAVSRILYTDEQLADGARFSA